MIWTYAYTPEIWPSLLTVLLMLGMAFYSSRRRSVPGVLPFIIACLFGAAWAAGSVLEYATNDLTTKIFWIKFQTAFQLPSATAATCFVLEYAWPGRWLTRRNLALLSVVPLLVLGLIATDHLNHFVWLSFNLGGAEVTAHLGPGGWMAIVYSFGLVFLSFSVFTWLFLHSPQHRWPVVIMVIGHIGVRTLYVLEKANLFHSVLPLDVLGLAFMILMYSIALFGCRIFDPIPLARQTTIGQLRDGMLVLDPQGRVASLNPAAEMILGAPLKKIQGISIAEILPTLPELSSLLTSTASFSKTIELNGGPGGGMRWYELDLSPLQDFRGLPVGHLLLLHDLTTQKQAQAQLLEQQRALAALKEREQIARELHDELAQELAFINAQAQSIVDLLSGGETDQANVRMQLLAKIAREAHVDVRGQITKLSMNIQPDEGFQGALRRFLEAFQRMYGIQAELILSQDQTTTHLEPIAEVEMLRIIQEAFTNIRKHACANHVLVSLAAQSGELVVTIKDDGVGFDAAKPASGQTYGLYLMSERAAEIGGRIEVQSVPGQGTRVLVAVPVRSEKGGANENFVGR